MNAQLAQADAPEVVAPAAGTGVAGLGCRLRLAVEGLGEQARRGGLADAARAGEEEGMRHAACGDRSLERAGHVILPDHIRESLRPKPPGEHLVCHLLE